MSGDVTDSLLTNSHLSIQCRKLKIRYINDFSDFCMAKFVGLEMLITHGYSLLRMAFVLRISPVKLRAVERGEWMPKWDIRILFRIRKKFGVQASELFADRLDR